MARAPPAMSTGGSRERTIGLAFMLISVSAGMHSCAGGGLGLLLCFVGGLVGASLIAAGIRKGDSDRPAAPTNLIDPVVLCGARALAAFVRRNAAAVGLVMASCAVTAVSGAEEDPVLCFGMFALLLLGVSLINFGARGA